MVDRDVFLQSLAIVEAHEDYRVLRRFQRRAAYNNALPGEPVHRALYVDVETTGLDTTSAEIIEFGAVPFTFTAEGKVLTVGEPFGRFEQPSQPISPEITEITGITDEMVQGKVIENADVLEIAAGVDLVIAHKAAYDRPIIERRWPGVFDRLAWACTLQQVPWKKYGVAGGALENVLATACRVFYEAHRAVDDCLAGIHALACATRMHEVEGDPGAWPLPAMVDLLETTRTGIFRVLAHDSPFEWKDRLKARGYFWTGEKPWKRDLPTIQAAHDEVLWLQQNVGGVKPMIKKISARDRYSVRA